MLEVIYLGIRFGLIAAVAVFTLVAAVFFICHVIEWFEQLYEYIFEGEQHEHDRDERRRGRRR